MPQAVTRAGVAQLVEHYLAKVDVAGSNPVSRSTVKSRDIYLGKVDVAGSNPVSRSKMTGRLERGGRLRGGGRL